ncbi:MAG: 1-acyl-sn-glycerol-3-phosphate acyltransferase [Candidatus Eiseniibacteriota bacterium]
MSVVETLGAACYGAARVIVGSAVRVYFGRIEVRHLERVPRSGPLLVVANHPATFADVMVLSTTLPRRIRFLAMAPIFKPWIRGLGLRLGGAIPVYRRQDDPTLMSKNEDTFRACHEILDRGGAVLIFPEGTSLTDRQIVRIKTGAARLALGQEARPEQRGRLTLLPVGLHFAERTQFQSDLVVSVGRPIPLDSFRDGSDPAPADATGDGTENVRRLTDAIQTALEKLILNIPEVDHTLLVHAIERIYHGELGQAMPGVPDLGLARGTADCIARVGRKDPERVAATWTRIQQYLSDLEALDVNDRALREMLPAQGRIVERTRLVLLGVAGILPALAGAALHYLPYRASGELGLKLAGQPMHVSATRIGIGVVLFPLTYVALGFLMVLGLGWPIRTAVIVLLAAVPLGLFALVYFKWLTHQRQRIRLVFEKGRNRRTVARLRRTREQLIAEFDAARREYLEEVKPAAGAS